MTVTHKFSGDGLAAGTLTTAKAGTGDNAFSYVNGTINIASAGARPPRLEFPAVGSNCAWVFGAAKTVGAYRGYWTAPSAVPTSNVNILRLKQGSAATGANCLSLAYNAFGSLRVFQTGGVQVGVSTMTFTANTTYRIGFTINHGDGSTTGAATIVIADANDNVLETINVTGANFLVNHTQVLWGTDSTTTAMNNNAWDDMAAADTATLIGAYVGANTAPTANAGADQSVAAGATVTLTGTATDDKAGYTTAWSQVSGTTVTLAGSGLTRTFTAPSAATASTLVFRFTVTDSDGVATTDDVSIAVAATGAANTPPVVNAGPDQSVAAGTTVTLTGTVTDDKTGVTSVWTQTSGTTVTLAGTGLTRTFDAPYVMTDQNLVFTLTATDSNGAVTTDTVQITVSKHRLWIHDGTTLKPGRVGIDSTNPPPPRVAATVSATVSEVGDGYGIVTYTLTANSDTVAGAYFEKTPTLWTTTLLTAPSGSQRFGQLTNGTLYTVKVTPVLADGTQVTASTVTVTFTPTASVVTPPSIFRRQGIYNGASSGYGEETMKTDLGTVTIAGTITKKYPDLMSMYVSFGVAAADPLYAAGGGPATTQVPPGNPYSDGSWYRDMKTATYSGWKYDDAASTNNDEKALADKGIARMATFAPHSSSVPKFIADGRTANPAGYDWAVGVMDGWIAKVKQRYDYAPDVPIYIATASEPDVGYQSGKYPDAPVMGKFFNWFFGRCRSQIPNVKSVLWVAGFQDVWINTMLTNITTNPPDVIAGDPYVNAAGYVTIKANFNKFLNKLRVTSWKDNYTRLQALHPKGKIEAAITENGMDKQDHTDTDIAKYLQSDGTTTNVGIRQAMIDCDVIFSIWFLSDSGPQGDHNFNDGAHPLSVAAWKNELFKTTGTGGSTGGSTGGGTTPVSQAVITTISAPTSLGDPDSTGVLKEVSGMIASRKNPGIFWAVNDQGTTSTGADIPPQVFAFAAVGGGRVLHTLTLTGTQAPANSNQFEDMSKCKMPNGEEGLMIGSIGNGGSYTFFRVAEPTVAVGQTPVSSNGACDRFAYVNNEPDYESFAVDPLTGDLFIIPKTGSTARPRYMPLYKIAADQFPSGGKTGISLGTAITQVRVDVESTGSGAPTAMDISDDGLEIMVGNYQELQIWHRAPTTQTVGQAFSATNNSAGQAIAPVRLWVPTTAQVTFGAESYCFAAGNTPAKGYSMAEAAAGGGTIKEFSFTRA